VGWVSTYLLREEVPSIHLKWGGGRSKEAGSPLRAALKEGGTFLGRPAGRPFRSHPGWVPAGSSLVLGHDSPCRYARHGGTMSTEASDREALSSQLPGTWKRESRVDVVTESGERRPEPSLGEDPIALLIYDRSGHFAAQFMKRDRSVSVPDGPVAGQNNRRAHDGYNAYFGTYTVDDQQGTVTQRLLGALSEENVGAVLTRGMSVVVIPERQDRQPLKRHGAGESRRMAPHPPIGAS
jgi:lipocalin-like protein